MTKQITDIVNFSHLYDTVIEASAGTGKTYTITKLIVPWLLKHTDYKLENILIVTYTNKATGELRDRIRKELHNMSAELIGKSDSASIALKNKLDAEIEKIDDAPIFTINSFCQKVLTENAIYSNCSQNMTLVNEEVELQKFIGKYIRDYLTPKEKIAFADIYDFPQTFINIMKVAVKKYYTRNQKEDPAIVSLICLTPEEEIIYNNAIELKYSLSQISDDNEAELKSIKAKSPTNNEILQHWFVIKHLPDIYNKWQLEKIQKNQQTYGDMIKTVYDAIANKPSKLLTWLQEKYKYAIIDEFQDTNKLQWGIFNAIFRSDNEHHITIVGDKKQSIFSFQGTDPKVYDIAKNEILGDETRETAIWNLDDNYRSTEPMINAINILAADSKFAGDIAQYYTPSKFPKSDNQNQHAQLNNTYTPPVHIIMGNTTNEEVQAVSPEDTIISKIIEYCTIGTDGKTPLQIWHKAKNKEESGYRNVTFRDFAILVEKRAHAQDLITKMTAAQIPTMWHKDSSLFFGKEAADWTALLSAIVAPDFNADNKKILRRALATQFFNIPVQNITDEKYSEILHPERQKLLKWRNLAQTHQYVKLITSVIDDSEIAKRLACYDKIQSLAKYNQIGNFILEHIVSKNGSMATAIKALAQQQDKNNNNEEEAESVEKATDNDMVQISTIHSAKGLEFPITIYILRNNKSKSLHAEIQHNDNGTYLQIAKNSKPVNPDSDALRYVAITRASAMMFLIDYDEYTKNVESIYDNDNLFIQVPPNNTYTSAAHILTQNAINTPEKPDAFPGRIPLSAKRLYKHSYTSLAHRTTDAGEETNILITDKAQRIDKEEDFSESELSSTHKYDSDCGVEINQGMYDYNNTTPVSADAIGAKYGTIIHEVFEHIDFAKFANTDKESLLEYLLPLIERCCNKHSFNCDTNKIADYVINTMSAHFPEIVGNQQTNNKFCLYSLPTENKKSEVEFDFGVLIDDNGILRNYCNGFIDLLFMHEVNGEHVYSILDWKSDLLESDKHYASYEHLKSRTNDKYSIQRVLYSYCLIKWLRQFYPELDESEIFNRHFGGVYYVYVRGCNPNNGNGIYAHTWANYEKLEAAFQNIIKGIYHG